MIQPTLVAALAGMIGFLLGGATADAVGDAVGLTAVVVALATIGTRALESLRDSSGLSAREVQERLERATGIGFFIGVAVSGAVFLVDLLVGS